MKILVTGASGFVGTNIINQLSETFDFFCLDRQPNPQLDAQHNFVGDITDFSFVEKTFEIVQPDVLIHLAAIVHKNNADTSEQNYNFVNFESSKHLFELSRKYQTKIIFSSTIEVFDTQYKEYTEETPCAPTSFYGKSKLKAEQYLEQMEYDNYAIVRFAPVYGKNFTLNVDKRVFLKKDKVAYFFKKGDYGFDFVSILNIVDFIAYVIQNQTKEKIFILSDTQKITVKQIIDLHKKYDGLKMVVKMPYVMCYIILTILEKLQTAILRRDAYLSRRNLLKLFANKTYSNACARQYISFSHDYEKTVYGGK